MGTILKAYKSGKPVKQVQQFEEFKKKLITEKNLSPLKELFRQDKERFFLYLTAQDTLPRFYLDYFNACTYLGLDMTLERNRFPHDLKRWHDIRIDEYHTAKALADEKEREALYVKFVSVAEKYMALQKTKDTYAVIIAKSPADLFHEGEILKHCVGKMNYEQKVVRGETLIFFVRHTQNPDIPFVTVEYSLQSKKVLQCYGSKNSKPEDTVLNYVNKVWLPHANKTIKKLQIAA